MMAHEPIAPALPCAVAARGASGARPGHCVSAIFISHSSRDSGFAAELRAWLQDHGYRSLFLDFDPADGIPAGRRWEQELYRQLRACQAVIVLCSEHSMSSDWCFAEITHARALGKLVFPLRIGPCRLREPLAELQVVDATGDRAAALDRLLRGLRAAGLEQLFAWDPARPPYPGLMAFQEADAAVYFGRDAEVRIALDALTRLRRFDGARLLVFLGASGSGKSSLLRAGIVPRLRQAGHDWAVLPTVRPLQRPVDELALVLAPAVGSAAGDWKAVADRLESAAASPAQAAALWSRWLRDLRQAAGGGERLVVLCVDQFEEALADTPQAGSFLRLLDALAGDPDRQAVVLATLRSDFLEALQKHPGWHAPFDTLPLAALDVDALVQVVEGPAQVAGIDVERGLAERLVADTGTDDGLPLLAFALRELWERDAKGGLLTIATYRDTLGGLQGAIARAAEGVVDIDALPPAQRDDLHAAFLALVRINEAGQYTRQAVRWDDLPRGAHALVERFVGARLLVSDREAQGRVVEVAHEALFRVWRRLREWLDADRDLLRLRDGVRRAAAEWSEKDRAADLLVHRGSRLEAAEALLREGRFALEAVQRDYLQACVAAREALLAAERERAAARRRRIRWTIGGLAAGLVVAVGLSVWAIRERSQATERLADLHWVTGIADRDVGLDPLKAAHHFAQTATLSKDPGDLRSAAFAGRLLAGGVELQAIVEPPGGVGYAAFGADGGQGVVWSPSGVAAKWPGGEGLAASQPLPESPLRKLVPSPHGRWLVRFADDGRRTIVGSRSAAAWVTLPPSDAEPAFDDAEARVAAGDGGVVRVWDAGNAAPRASLDHPARVVGAAFSPDGRHLLTWDAQRTARLWAVDGGVRLAEHRATADLAGGRVGDGGAAVLLWGRQAPALLWRPAEGSVVPLPVDKERVPVTMNAAFVAGGQVLLTWNYGGVGVASVWDAASGALRWQLSQDLAIGGVTTDAAARRLLSWSEDGSAVVADLSDGAAQSVLRHRAGLRGASLSPDGARVLTWSDDATARVWDAASGDALSLPLHHAGAVRGAAWAPGGRSVLSWDSTSARVWRVDESAGVRVVALSSSAPLRLAAFGAAEGEFVTLTRDGRLQRRVGAQPVGAPVELGRDIAGAAFDREGRRLLTWSADHRVEVRSVDSGQALTPPMRHDPSDFGIRGATFDADGRRILSWGDDRSARVWQADTGQATAVLRHPAPVAGAAFGGDGETALTWADDRRVRVWELASGRLAREWPAAPFGIRGALPARDGATLYAWDSNGTIRRLRAAGGDAAGEWSHGAGVAVVGAQASGDDRLLSWDERGGLRIWDLGARARAEPAAAWSVRGLRGAAFSADGRIVLTWADAGVRLWDSRTAQPLSAAFDAGGPVTGAEWHRGGQRLLAWSDRALRIWDFGAEADRPDAEAAARVELRSGTRLDRSGQVEVLSASAWQALRDRLGPPAAGR